LRSATQTRFGSATAKFWFNRFGATGGLCCGLLVLLQLLAAQIVLAPNPFDQGNPYLDPVGVG
jgi:hypothetical protein